jgi:hypothetical protein
LSEEERSPENVYI